MSWLAVDRAVLTAVVGFLLRILLLKACSVDLLLRLEMLYLRSLAPESATAEFKHRGSVDCTRRIPSHAGRTRQGVRKQQMSAVPCVRFMQSCPMRNPIL